MEKDDKEIPLSCSLGENGDVTCKVSKKEFAEIQKADIKPKKMVFEIDE